MERERQRTVLVVVVVVLVAPVSYVPLATQNHKFVKIGSLKHGLW